MMWVEFNKATGRVLQSVSGSSVVPPEETDTLGRLDDAGPVDNRVYYIDPSTRILTARPVSSITSTQADRVITLSGVNVGTVVSISGDALTTITQDATDGGLEITLTNAGSYSISAEQFPEQPFQLSVTV